jgi:hypothetical protein
LTAQLLTFAEFEFKLLQVVDGEKSLKDHLEQIEATTGVTPAELMNPVELPPELEHVWNWFIELSNSRPAGFSGLEPISFPLIESWMRTTGVAPTRFEVNTIRLIDDVYRKLRQKK